MVHPLRETIGLQVVARREAERHEHRMHSWLRGAWGVAKASTSAQIIHNANNQRISVGRRKIANGGLDVTRAWEDG